MGLEELAFNAPFDLQNFLDALSQNNGDTTTALF